MNIFCYIDRFVEGFPPLKIIRVGEEDLLLSPFCIWALLCFDDNGDLTELEAAIIISSISDEGKPWYFEFQEIPQNYKIILPDCLLRLEGDGYLSKMGKGVIRRECDIAFYNVDNKKLIDIIGSPNIDLNSGSHYTELRLVEDIFSKRLSSRVCYQIEKTPLSGKHYILQKDRDIVQGIIVGRKFPPVEYRGGGIILNQNGSGSKIDIQQTESGDIINAKDKK